MILGLTANDESRKHLLGILPAKVITVLSGQFWVNYSPIPLKSPNYPLCPSYLHLAFFYSWLLNTNLKILSKNLKGRTVAVHLYERASALFHLGEKEH